MKSKIFMKEIISMKHLDKVSGGTNRECKELKKAIPNV